MNKFNVKDLDLRIAYSKDGIETHIDSANKQDKYYLDVNKKIPLVFCKGDIVKPYFRSEANIPERFIKEYLGGSESLIHYNTKMEFYRSKRMEFEDNIILGYSSQTEYTIKKINKTIDVVFFDEKGDLLVGIEVLHTNPKKLEDIQKFNQINVPIYEYNINTREMQLISYGGSCAKIRKEQQLLTGRITRGREFIQVLEKGIEMETVKFREEEGDINELNYHIEEVISRNYGRNSFSIEREIKDVEENIREGRKGEINDIKRIESEINTFERICNQLQKGIGKSDKEINKLLSQYFVQQIK